MIVSMTGCGQSQLAEDGVSYSIEIRSLNNRYFKLSIKLPETLQILEDRVDKLLRSQLRRGSIHYQLRVHGDGALAAYTINVGALQSYVDQMTDLRVPNGVHASLDLAALAALPGVSEPPQPDTPVLEKQAAIVESLSTQALNALLDMRRQEGQALYRDLMAHCQAIREKLKIISEHASQVVEEYQQRLKVRVDRLLAQSRIELDSDSLMREVAIYADRSDISEELTRLESHLAQFVSACDNDTQVGRKLDFLTQEMFREANTISSKSNQVTIARCIVEVKSLIDRIKEQVQNVE